MNYLTIEVNKIPSRFLEVYLQNGVGEKGYDEGYRILVEFFNNEVRKYDQEDIPSLGKKIIDACLNDAAIEEYNELIET